MGWGDAWILTEERLTNWLAGKMGHTLGVEAYRAEDFPRAMMHGDEDAVAWCLSLGGGEVEPQRQSRNEITGGCWHVNGEIIVRGRSANAARRAACELFGWLPVGPDDVENVARLYAKEYPTLQKVLLLAGDAALENEIAFEGRIAVRCAYINPTTEE